LPGLLKVQGGLKGWTESMRTAIDRTEGFSAGAHALAEKAVDLSRQLEATRGKTVDVTRAQAEVPGVMNRSTEAIVDYAAARKKQEEIDKRIFAGMHKFAETQGTTDQLLQQGTRAVIDYVKAHRVAAEV